MCSDLEGRDTHMFGPGRSSGFGPVDGDMDIVGLGKSSGLGTTGEETNLLGLHRSSPFDSFNEQNFNIHAITPFHSDGMQGWTLFQWTNQFCWQCKT